MNSKSDDTRNNKLRSILIHLYYRGYHEGKGDFPNSGFEITLAQDAIQKEIERQVLEGRKVIYDPNKLGSYIFVGSNDEIKNLDDLFDPTGDKAIAIRNKLRREIIEDLNDRIASIEEKLSK